MLPFSWLIGGQNQNKDDQRSDIFIEMNKPKQLEYPDIEAIKEMAKKYVDFIDSDEYHSDNDYEYYIYETVMTALYGEDFWRWLGGKI